MRHEENRDLDRYATPEVTGKIVKKTRGTLANDRYLRRGLPYIKDRGRILYDVKDIEAYMESHKIKV